MKINKLFISVFIFISLISCEDNSGLSVKPEIPETNIPDRRILNSFQKRFGNVSSVKWSIKDEYYVADFSQDSYPAIAWFDKEGDWLMDQIGTSYEDYLQVVSNTIADTDYEDWQIEDAQILERNGFSTVHFVVLKKDNKKSNFYFTKYGEFYKVVKDADNYIEKPIIVPDPIHQTINQLFDKPELVDVDWNDDVITDINVGILDRFDYKTIALNNDYSWIATFWNLNENTVPQQVFQGFSSSEYGVNNIDSIRGMQDTEGLFYHFYFRNKNNNNKETVATFNDDGSIKVVISY